MSRTLTNTDVCMLYFKYHDQRVQLDIYMYVSRAHASFMYVCFD